MDSSVLTQLLNEAESTLLRGERQLEDQRDRIVALARRGQDTGAARALLRRLEGRQARHMVERNRLFAQLRGAQAFSDTPHAQPATRHR